MKRTPTTRGKSCLSCEHCEVMQCRDRDETHWMCELSGEEVDASGCCETHKKRLPFCDRLEEQLGDDESSPDDDCLEDYLL